MKNNERRRAKPEAQIHLGETAQFIAWPNQPWSKEEKTGALRQNPAGKIFWKSLSKTIPPETRE